MGEVATQDKAGQGVVPAPAPRSAIETGSRPAALNPRNLPEAMQLAQMIADSGMVPKAYQEKDGAVFPGKVLVGIMAGQEIGLAPFQSLQSIAVIGNNPAIWGDGALALVLGSGLLVDMQEDDDGHTATCTMVRKGRSTPIVRSFSVDDAKKAGLFGKTGPWSQYPKRMRQMRARLFAIRDGFADVLKGLSIAEEVQDYAPVDGGVIAGRKISTADLREQAKPRAEAEADQSLDDDAQFLAGDGSGQKLPEVSQEQRAAEVVADLVDDGAIAGVSDETAETLREGRSDEQHGDQHDGTDDAGDQAATQDEPDASEAALLLMIKQCEDAQNDKHYRYVKNQFDKAQLGLSLEQIKRFEAPFNAMKARLNIA